MLTVGVDIGGTKGLAGVVDVHGRVLTRQRRLTPGRSVTAVEDTIVISCKDVLDGVGHKVAPGEKDQLERLGKA